MIREIFYKYAYKWYNTPVNEQDESFEWLLADFRKESLKNLDAPGAFEAIPEAIELLLEENDDFLCWNLLLLLEELASRSDTTEIPATLAQNWDRLELKLASLNKPSFTLSMNGLKTWYRVK